METISIPQAKELIKESKGKIFTCTFIKKDGTLREMNCRQGVKKGVKGKGLAFDPKTKGLIPVFDMQGGHFRMINEKTLQTLTILGEMYEIEK